MIENGIPGLRNRKNRTRERDACTASRQFRWLSHFNTILCHFRDTRIRLVNRKRVGDSGESKENAYTVLLIVVDHFSPLSLVFFLVSKANLVSGEERESSRSRG